MHAHIYIIYIIFRSACPYMVVFENSCLPYQNHHFAGFSVQPIDAQPLSYGQLTEIFKDTFMY